MSARHYIYIIHFSLVYIIIIQYEIHGECNKPFESPDVDFELTQLTEIVFCSLYLCTCKISQSLFQLKNTKSRDPSVFNSPYI